MATLNAARAPEARFLIDSGQRALNARAAALGALLLEQAGEGQCAAEASTAAAVAAGVYLAAAEVPLGAESAAAAALHGVEAAGAMSTG